MGPILLAPAGKPDNQSGFEKKTNSSIAKTKVPDLLLDCVLKEFSTKVMEATKARGISAVDSAKTKSYARGLIDAPDDKRILWVDDRPNNNRFETAALAKL